MKSHLPIIADDDEHRVLEFRPRTALRRPQFSSGVAAERPPRDALLKPNDLSRYEGGQDDADDFNQRMLGNTLAFVLTVALIAVGIWLAMSIEHMRNTQDCLLVGRTNCASITPPHL
jgi:hypothetical protein